MSLPGASDLSGTKQHAPRSLAITELVDGSPGNPPCLDGPPTANHGRPAA